MTYRAIIIDDELWSRESIRKLGNWKALGIEIAGEASDGEMGLMMIEKLNPNIVIMDMSMPVMDGIDLLKRLHTSHPELKIIVISGFDDYSYMREAVRYNTVDYLLKPVIPEEFQTSLRKCIEMLGYQNNQSHIYQPEVFNKKEIMNGYLNLREALDACLYDLNMKSAIEIIDKIEILILENKETKKLIELGINIFYDLSWLLEQFIARNYESFYNATDDVFVFNRNTTVDDVIAHLKNQYSRTIEFLSENKANQNHFDVNRVQIYVDNHYTENIKLETVASKYYITKEYLSKIFKQHTGYNFTEYINMKRMIKAKEMIIEYEIQFKNVSDLLGFSDLSHFYKNFKKYYGMTPGEMLSQHNNNPG